MLNPSHFIRAYDADKPKAKRELKATELTFSRRESAVDTARHYRSAGYDVRVVKRGQKWCMQARPR